MKIRFGESKIAGRGVFATEKIRKGEMIEACPVLLIEGKPPGELMGVTYDWGRFDAVALGFGSLYNHSPEPNACYWFEKGKRLVVFEALRTIYVGDEITISYAKDEKDLWFEPKETV